DANLLKIKEWTMEKVKAETISVGTASISNGIEMKDTATGLSYCVRITNGQMVNTAGDCSSSISGSSSIPAQKTAPTAPIINNAANVTQSFVPPIDATQTSTTTATTTPISVVEATATTTPAIITNIVDVPTTETVPEPVIPPISTPAPVSEPASAM
ncbi:MAG: hypothetical protein WCP15_03745, partial [bacterium]